MPEFGKPLILGLEASFEPGGLHINQWKYSLQLHYKFDLLDSKPIETLEVPGKHLSYHDDSPIEDPTKFSSLMGALQYLTLSWLDIAHIVNQVCKFRACSHGKLLRRYYAMLKALSTWCSHSSHNTNF